MFFSCSKKKNLANYEVYNVPLENLYPVVFPITYDDVATGHNGDTFKTLELSVSRTPGPESPEEGSIRMEDLDSIVARISHYDVALVIDSNTPDGNKIYLIIYLFIFMKRVIGDYTISAIN